MKRLVLLLVPAGLAAQGGLEVRIVQSSGPVHILGSRSASALTVAVADTTGSPVPGAAVSFQLPASGPCGVFHNGLTTDVAVTGADGRASASAVRWNRIPGPCDIRVTAAKGGLRASVLSPHRLLASFTESTGAGAAISVGRSRRKIVLILAAVAAASATAGLAVARRTSAGSGSPPSGVGLSVGTPTITVGGPQ